MATFSYAQAAKGLSSAATPTAAPSKTTSGKDAATTNPTAPIASVSSWADDADAEDSRTAKQASSGEEHTNAAPAPTKQASGQDQNTISGASSPDLGASSASTAVKEDDAVSLQNASSDSTTTWEKQSQASTSVERTSEPADKSEKITEKPKGKISEKVPIKLLQEAPVPTVNPWTRRADERKAQVVHKVTAPKQNAMPSTAPLPNGTSHGVSTAAVKKSKLATDGLEAKEKTPSTENQSKTRDEDKAAAPRRDTKPDTESEKARRAAKGRSMGKDGKPVPTALPLPPHHDQESWPTPETALDEDRKKAQIKGEKSEKERKESSTGVPHGKHEWVKVPYTPTVVFNTPLPNTATSRRGGRGGGRGGGQSGGRSNGIGAPSAGNADKDASVPLTVANGEPKRGRADASGVRDASPKDKRTSSIGSPSWNETTSTTNTGEKPSNTAGTPEGDIPSQRASVNPEHTSGVSASNQNHSFPRSYPPSRPNKPRRGGISPPGEKRKDSGPSSPTKEASGPYDRRTDVPEEGDRRASTFPENQNGHSKSNDRRQFGSFSGRERGRGGGRGGRGGYQNGHHQFANGHAPPLQSSTSFPLPRSPTTFHPDQSSFYPAPNHGRSFRGPRSQSVTAENVYTRMPSYPGGPQQMPPLNTYMGGMYDMPMMPPLSASPFGSYGIDQLTLLNMVKMQLEYYFSVENLCKDIFLRKHMDSKGFVFLSVIAEFNRIKQLTTDIELIKLVCYQSPSIDFFVGHDGKDRLRPRKGWTQWVMSISERDPSAQNDGPEELHDPPTPRPQGFEQNPSEDIHGAGSNPHPMTNGVSTNAPLYPSEDIHGAGSNGYPIESSKAVSDDSDSFSDQQVETLSVIVRKQDQAPALPPSAIRTFSNGSIDSRSGPPDEPEKANGLRSALKVNGIGPSQGSGNEDRAASASAPSSAAALTPVRLYWVKGKDTPVESLPHDSTYESYTQLRLKALEQRRGAVSGTCPYDMDVLYQFWSHFLIRNFNRNMYDEFRSLAVEDSRNHMSDVGLANLIKYYGEALLSSHNLIRERVARHYVELVKSETPEQRPAFKQLRSTLRNGALDPRNRRRIGDYIDDELRIALE